MSAAMSSSPVIGLRTLSSTTSLRTSTFLDMCDPFWLAGRSTNMSMEQFSALFRVLFIPSLLTRTGLRTPLTPTRVSLYPASPLPYWRSHFNVMMRSGMTKQS